MMVGDGLGGGGGIEKRYYTYFVSREMGPPSPPPPPPPGRVEYKCSARQDDGELWKGKDECGAAAAAFLGSDSGFRLTVSCCISRNSSQVHTQPCLQLVLRS